MQITTIFYHTDEFCKQFKKNFQKSFFPKVKRDRKCSLELSEIMTIAIYFHYSGYKTFKDYYCKHVMYELK